MAEPDPISAAGPRVFPRVPAYAWSWLQRSRPVLQEAAKRLTGGPPPGGYVDSLRERFAEDAFTRDVLVAVIADVAFNGRIPRHRPAGASWDRGLTWWAAAIAGVTPDQFESAGPDVEQSRLFGVEEPPPTRRRSGGGGPTRRASGSDRAMLSEALRNLLRTARDGQIPVAGVQALLAQLEDPHSADGPSRQ